VSFFSICLNYVNIEFRLDGDLLFFAGAKQRRQKKHAPSFSAFFTFANFYGQFVNLPLRGFEHDKLTLKS
jgi:hypothetical protein